MKLPISQIRLDGGTQAREKIDEETVDQYAEVIAEAGGFPFPPVTVYHDGTNYWLAGGFHRYRAAERQCLAEIPADVRPGTLDDAVEFASGDNSDHGKPRTPGDKRCAVLMLISKPRWAGWSDNAIAKAAKVSQPFVAKVRSETSSNVRRCEPRKVERNGKTYEMQTANIGAKHAPVIEKPSAPAPAPAAVPTAKPSQIPPEERARLAALADEGHRMLRGEAIEQPEPEPQQDVLARVLDAIQETIELMADEQQTVNWRLKCAERRLSVALKEAGR